METNSKQTPFLFFVSITLFLFFMVTTTHAAKPLYKPGEIVVKGDGSEFGEYEVVKELPYSGYTLLKVVPGKELAQLRKLRDKGKKGQLKLYP